MNKNDGLHDLLFVLPYIILYESTVQFLDGYAGGMYARLVQNSFTHFPSILLLIYLLLGIVIDKVYKVEWIKVAGLYGESFFWACIGILLAQSVQGYYQWTSMRMDDLCGTVPMLDRKLIIVAVGAGLYEELFFRSILIGGMVAFWKNPYWLCFCALISSIAFCRLHFNPSEYVFCVRFILSLMFSFLYLKRGIGVAIGSHALYDIIVMAMMQPATLNLD